MELYFTLYLPSLLKQSLCSIFAVFYFAVCCNFILADNVPKDVGGYCISYAQRECRDLSDPLYEGIFKPTPTTDICRLFNTYHHCIQGITLSCPITEAEKTFYDTSFVQFFNKEYGCHISTTGQLQHSHRNRGASQNCNFWLSWRLGFLLLFTFLTNQQWMACFFFIYLVLVCTVIDMII